MPVSLVPWLLDAGAVSPTWSHAFSEAGDVSQDLSHLSGYAMFGAIANDNIVRFRVVKMAPNIVV